MPWNIYLFIMKYFETCMENMSWCWREQHEIQNSAFYLPDHTLYRILYFRLGRTNLGCGSPCFNQWNYKMKARFCIFYQIVKPDLAIPYLVSSQKMRIVYINFTRCECWCMYHGQIASDICMKYITAVLNDSSLLFHSHNLYCIVLIAEWIFI